MAERRLPPTPPFGTGTVFAAKPPFGPHLPPATLQLRALLPKRGFAGRACRPPPPAPLPTAAPAAGDGATLPLGRALFSFEGRALGPGVAPRRGFKVRP